MITRIQMRSGGNVWMVDMVGGVIISRQAVGEESVFIFFPGLTIYTNINPNNSHQVEKFALGAIQC